MHHPAGTVWDPNQTFQTLIRPHAQQVRGGKTSERDMRRFKRGGKTPKKTLQDPRMQQKI